MHAAHKYDASLLLDHMEQVAVERMTTVQKEQAKLTSTSSTLALTEAIAWSQPADELKLQRLAAICMDVLTAQPKCLGEMVSAAMPDAGSKEGMTAPDEIDLPARMWAQLFQRLASWSSRHSGGLSYGHNV